MEAVIVVARFRGAETGDTDFGEWILTDNTIKHAEKHHEFNFDAVLNPSRTQEELYEAAGRKIIDFFCDGYNATIFAYGQSGSGKTFSMLGPEEVTEILINSKDNIPTDVAKLFGITPRATFHLFDNIKEGHKKGTKYNLKVSYLEVYNEMINDILASPPNTNLKLREFPNQGMCVIGLLEHVANSPEGVFEALSNGTANRVVCSTGQNARSSRSHTVFVMSLEQTQADGTQKSAKINLVDLAGSEKLSKTGAQGQALKEAQKINLSLTTLGRCIKALTSGGAEHVPYRESKLTLILKESLSGAAMTTLIVTGSMRKVHQEETISTMQFAERAKMVKTSAKSNTKRSYEELEKLFNKLSEEVQQLKKGLMPEGAVLSEEVSGSSESNPKFEELKEKYQELKENSQKEIEVLRKQIEKAEANMSQIDYLEVHEEMEFLKDQLDADNRKLGEISKEKENERSEFEKKINGINLKIESLGINTSHLQRETENNHRTAQLYDEELKAKDEVIFKLNQEVQEVKAHKKELKKELEDLEEKSKKQGLQNSDLLNNMEKIRHAINEGNDKKAQLNESIDKAELEAQEIIGKSLFLQKKDAQFLAEIEKLTEEKTHLQHELAKVKEEITLKLREQEKAKLENEELLRSSKADNESLKAQLHDLEKQRSAIEKSPQIDHFNELKQKYADEKSAPLIAQIEELKQIKQKTLKDSQKESAELEEIKEISKKNEEENRKLKEELKTATSNLNKISKEISDENSSKLRITKNIKAIEDSLAKAIKEAEQFAKTEEQLKITEYIQNVNIMQKEIEKKENYIENTKKAHNSELQKLKQEITQVRKEISESDLKISNLQKERHSQSDMLEKEKSSIFQSLSDKNDEILRLKEIISANEGRLNQNATQIAKLEADVRLKAAERDIERKNTMRQTIVPRKMSIMTAPIPKPEGVLHQVQLKKTGNKFLEEAIKESNRSAMSAPINDRYKVHYDLQVIRALYANIDEVNQESDEKIMEDEEEYKRSESSDSD